MEEMVVKNVFPSCHILYGSLLVRHRCVVNKACRLSPSAAVTVSVVRIHRTLGFAYIAPEFKNGEGEEAGIMSEDIKICD
jgi:hypothetical protein